jgi:hypothetical protein
MKLSHLFEQAISVNAEASICKSILARCRSFFYDKELSYDEVEDYLNDQFRSLLITFTRSPHFNDEFDSSNPSINNCIHDATFFTANNEIEITLLSGVEDIVSDGYKFDEFSSELMGIINHELVHRLQIERARITQLRQQDPSNLHEYLSDKYEIMAYAKQATHEISVTTGMPAKEIAEKLTSQNGQRELQPFSRCLRVYLDEFEKDSPVRKRFLKTIIEYLQAD